MSSGALSTKNQAKHLSYYRSQLYTAYLGVNPLVTAAHPLLSVIERVTLATKPDISLFQDNLTHEFKAFEARALTSGYDEETVFISRYLLAATINECIEQEEPHALFSTLISEPSEEDTPDTKFYVILDRIIDKPNHYLDLLELVYFCLSIGFKGQYADDEEALQQVTDSLYETIAPLRQTNQKSLFVKPMTTPNSSGQTKLKVNLLVIVVLCLSMFFVSNYLLDSKAVKLSQQIAMNTETTHVG